MVHPMAADGEGSPLSSCSGWPSPEPFGVGMGTVVRERRTVRVGIGAATVAAGALLMT
jgi:hypothetical protein